MTPEHAGPSVQRADPAPLGFAALALPTLVLSAFTSGLVPSAGEPVVLGLALAYGGLGLLLAGGWAFATGSTFGATAFTSLGAHWLSFWAFVTFYVETIPAAEVGHAYGVYGIGWSVVTLGLLVASLRTTAAIATVLLLLTAMFGLLGLGNASGTDGIREAGGYVGLLAAVAALYTSCAALTNATYGRVVLPVRPLGHETGSSRDPLRDRGR